MKNRLIKAVFAVGVDEMILLSLIHRLWAHISMSSYGAGGLNESYYEQHIILLKKN